jgi:hypothetical protein
MTGMKHRRKKPSKSEGKDSFLQRLGPGLITQARLLMPLAKAVNGPLGSRANRRRPSHSTVCWPCLSHLALR